MNNLTDQNELDALKINIYDHNHNNNILVLTTTTDDERWLPETDNFQRYCVDEVEYNREQGKQVPAIKPFGFSIIFYSGSDYENKGLEWFMQTILSKLEFLFPSIVLFAGDDIPSAISVFDVIKANINCDSGTRFLFLINSRESMLYSLSELLRINNYQITVTIVSKADELQGPSDCDTQKRENAIASMLHRAYHDKGIPYNRDFATSVNEITDYWWHIRTYFNGWKSVIYATVVLVVMTVTWGLASYGIIPEVAAFVPFCTTISMSLIPFTLHIARALFLRVRF